MAGFMHIRDGKVAGWSFSLSMIGAVIGFLLLAVIVLPWWVSAIVVGCFALAYGYDRFAARYNKRVDEHNRRSGQ